MNDPATSLDRLHDIAVPPSVPWWPPATGWYVAVLFVLALVLVLVLRAVRRYRRNAYRRAALRELASLGSVAAIAELLRRTALVIVPRTVVAGMTGAVWMDWLAAQSAEPMSPEVRRQLTAGVYGPPAADREVGALRDYAARWISGHRPVPPDATGSA